MRSMAASRPSSPSTACTTSRLDRVLLMPHADVSERRPSMASSPALPARFVALDIRSNAVMIGAVDARRNVALTPRQVALGALESWGRLHLRPADAVVIAAPI